MVYTCFPVGCLQKYHMCWKNLYHQFSCFILPPDLNFSSTWFHLEFIWIYWDPLESIGIHWYLFGSLKSYLDWLVSIGIPLDTFGSIGIHWNPLGAIKINGDPFVSFGIYLNPLSSIKKFFIDYDLENHRYPLWWMLEPFGFWRHLIV